MVGKNQELEDKIKGHLSKIDEQHAAMKELESHLENAKKEHHDDTEKFNQKLL